MIDEDVLRQLLAEAADTVPPPGRTPEALLEDLSATRAQVVRFDRPRMLKPVGAAAAALLVVVLVALSATSGSGDRSETSSTSDEATSAPVAPGDGSGAGSGVATSGQANDSDQTAAGSGPSSQVKSVPTDAARVVKTGSMSLEIDKGTFEKAVDRITALVTGMGGYVAESSTSEADKVPSGSITVRVPASSFEPLLTELRRLGTVESVNSKGVDVTAQFKDLEARLSALRATRDRLFEVLRGARNIGDIIAVQDRITGVQTEIEQLQGQQGLLEDQASFGTVAVTLAEPGAKIEATSESDDGIGSAWREARRRFGDAVEALVEASGTLAVVLLAALVLGGLGWFGWRRGRRLFV
ncbi:MAG TPA: DUF4349 domain-containing protein [Candidatus Limnocylindrales bacterium]